MGRFLFSTPEIPLRCTCFLSVCVLYLLYIPFIIHALMQRGTALTLHEQSTRHRILTYNPDRTFIHLVSFIGLPDIAIPFPAVHLPPLSRLTAKTPLLPSLSENKSSPVHISRRQYSPVRPCHILYNFSCLLYVRLCSQSHLHHRIEPHGQLPQRTSRRQRHIYVLPDSICFMLPIHIK